MNAIAPGFGCALGGMPFEDALQRVLGLVRESLATEEVALEACVGRTSGSAVAARLDLPGFDQSAMDGYAVCSAWLTPGMWLPVTGRTAAGEALTNFAPGGAHRILTGAPMPQGADAVIAQENLVRGDDVVQVAAVPPAGTNVRRKGEDVCAGESLVVQGTVLDWRHVAVFAAQGLRSVYVRQRPRVALLSSGRELRAAGDNLAPGQIHDSNLPMLTALLQSWGAEVRPLPIVADDAPSTRVALCAAAADADLVMTTAGISVGDEDHVRDAVEALGGNLAVLKVAMKPGKPLAAGRLGGAVFIGLPGNPMAALAGAVAFVRPLLARMAGALPSQAMSAYVDFELHRKPGRTEFIAVRLRQREACWWAERAGPDGSRRLSPLLVADELAVVPADEADVRPGRLLEVMALWAR